MSAHLVWDVGIRRVDLDAPCIMGILNATPDSFSDGGRFAAPPTAIAHALAMVGDGAAILDVGGESTRPGAPPVPADEQLRRVLPVIRGVRARSDVPLSIDTTDARVAAEALAAGADIVNDVSAGQADPDLLPLVASRGAGVVLMHMRGTPRTMQDDVHYDDIAAEVATHLAERAAVARAAGIPAARIVLDPGIGFAKDVMGNLRLLRHLDRLLALGYPVLVGVSRKAFLGVLTGRPVGEREAATVAVVTAATLAGAHVLRVHDVRPCFDAVRVATAIRSA